MLDRSRGRNDDTTKDDEAAHDVSLPLLLLLLLLLDLISSVICLMTTRSSDPKGLSKDLLQLFKINNVTLIPLLDYRISRIT